jgi:hypothetical protein
VLEVEESVRALLRDVLCGYLDADLKHAADDILLRSSEPVEIHARDNRRWAPSARSQIADDRSQTTDDRSQEEPQPAAEVPQPPPEPELPEPPEEPDTDEFEVVEDDDDGLAAGVTPSADWDLDEDPGSYSAPV